MTDTSRAACLACLDRWMAALNAYDNAAMDAELHFPHVRFAGGKVAVYGKPGTNPMDLFERLKRDSGWHHSAWNRRDIVQRNDTQVHFAVNYTRYRADGSIIGAFDSIYVVTCEDGHWGIKARSSFAP